MTTTKTDNLGWDKPVYPSDNLASELDTLVDQIDVDVAALGGEWSVSDSGTEILTGPGDLNFGALLAVTDDTDGTVTIDADLSAHEGDSDIHHTRYADSEAISAVNNDTDHGSTASHNYFSGSHTDLTDISASDHHTRYADSEAISAINNDTDHGSTASHNYFSGSHTDLTDITSSDHHTRYADSEAVSAVNAETSLSVDISGDADSVDGYDIQKNGTDGSGIINFKT